MKLNAFILKIITYKHIGIVAIILLIISCSTKKDKFVNRTFHAKTAKYNVLFNGDEALAKGLQEISTEVNDNFWKTLPVEVMQEKEEEMLPGAQKNANIQRAEDKAVKAIQKHSMNIQGSEKNSQMDEAYILLGKARYYDNRFLPSLEAFNYVLYKSPTSDKIYDAKVWREKVNIRLENDALAVKNLKLLLKDKKIEGQDLANASAMLSQAYMNLGIKDTALSVLKIAKENTKINDQKARYTFIIGQLYEELNHQDSAAIAFQEVIDMKRKSPRKYTVQAHGKLAKQFDFEKDDTISFLKKYDKLLDDRENRPYLDALNHQLGLFYDKQKKNNQALNYYNKSLRKQAKDVYLAASNYRNMAEIYFEQAQYIEAGKYYDSTLTRLNDRTKEYRTITKKRQNLDDVIKYETIVKANDSILHVSKLSISEREAYFLKQIEELKKSDAKKALIAEKSTQQNIINSEKNGLDSKASQKAKNEVVANESTFAPPTSSFDSPDSDDNKFYFYNQSNIALGKTQFRKKWGNRALKDNWRWTNFSDDDEDKNSEKNDSIKASEIVKEEYKLDYYLKKVITDSNVLDSITKERNFADFQLGTIYKEKFKEYVLAKNKFEKLLSNTPEERLILPSKYNLLKLYELLNDPKKDELKNQIIAEFPDSRYAQILANPNSEIKDSQSPEANYKLVFKELSQGNIREANQKCAALIEKYNGDEMVSKFELLKAQINARLNGLESYKVSLNFVALNYPNTEEGKTAESLLQKDIPNLEKLDFISTEATTWKIVFPKNYLATKETEELQKKLDKYIKDRNSSLIKQSLDLYNNDSDFVVIHGISTKEIATSTLDLLKEYKDYQIKDQAFVISSENYKVVQIKKNWEQYLATVK